MKLTKEQINEIKNQQSQSNHTKSYRTRTRKILYEAIPALDHGFVRVMTTWAMTRLSSIC